jgi:pilus assembly protein CpaF
MFKNIKDKIKDKIISEYSSIFGKERFEEQELRYTVKRILTDIINRENLALPEPEKDKLVGEIMDGLIGLGPIEDLLKDPAITEIMINGPKKIYIEKDGKKQLSNITLEDNQQLMALIYRILAPTRRHVDESYPYTDVTMGDGSRVNIIIPPLSLAGPVVTIRKFLKELRLAEDLVKFGTLDRKMADFLVACIKAKVNIVFSGSTGAGKTTTLNVLSAYIPKEERIVTIEDTAELHLSQDHVVRLEARQPSIEGKGEVTIRDLFKNSLRMRPDRIIIGEIRSGEALEMLQAISSGHGGTLAVIHANSPQDVIYRLETMLLACGVPISLEAIQRQIATTLNIIVHQEHLSDGSRKITHISQVSGLKNGQVELEDIFEYEIENAESEKFIVGRWKATGAKPLFMNMLKKKGIKLNQDIFNRDE